MYESAFGFDRRPFVEAPQLDLYYPASAIQQARDTLVRCIDRAEGVGLLIGPSGTGKTLLCHLLADQFGQAFRVAMLASTRLCTRRALLQNILFELGLPYRDMEEGELRLTLIDHLQPSSECPHGMLLIVDEAHNLPLRLLEELRMITNLVRDGSPRVRLLLAGSPLLEERFASPRLESFNQRIAARCYLHSFNRDETFQSIRQQITTVGGNEQLFTDDALAAIHTATDGIARLINQLCDHALMMASIGGHQQLDAAGIEEAWADLQQLPLPQQSSTSTIPVEQSEVIEFGQLSDEHDSFDDKDTKGQEEMIVESFDPADQLDRIQRDVAFAIDDVSSVVKPDQPNDIMAGSQFEPLVGQGPEVELVFHASHDPFGHPFEEEEVVVDRYATLDADTLKNHPKVSSEESRKLTAAFNRTFVDDTDSNDSAVRITAAFDPASDPVMPDLETGQVNDQNMIIIVDDEPSAEQIPPVQQNQGRAQRQEYRQLFSKMRQG